MFRDYPRPERMWRLEDLALLCFCTTVSLGKLGIIGQFTFTKLFLVFGIPYWAARAFFRRDPWLFQLPLRDWNALAMLALLFGYLLSTFNVTSYEYYAVGLVRYFGLYVTALWMAGVIRDNRKRFLWVFVAIALSSMPNALGGVFEVATGKQILKFRAQGTEEMRAVATQMRAGGDLTGGGGGRRCVSFQGGGGDNAVHSLVWTSLSALLPFLVKHPTLRLLAIGLVGINMINVIATGSRSGIVGLAVALALFLYFIEIRGSRKLLIIALGIVGLLAATVIFDFPIARLLHRTAASKGTVSFRILQWQTAYSMFRQHPILGVGPGNFMTEYHRYHYDFPSHDKVIVIGPLHNAILNQLAEGGLVGLSLLTLLIVSVLLTCYKVRLSSPDPVLRHASVALMAGFAGWCAALFFYPSLGDQQGWMIIGQTIALWNVHKKILQEAAPPRETAPVVRVPYGELATT